MNEGNNTTTDTPKCEERMNTIKPNFVVPAITEDQCENLKNNTGIYGQLTENCEDLTGELLCDIRQCLEYVVNMGVGNVFANEDSKCRDNDTSPTLASMWSRIYRFAQAVTCVLCAYDPFINTLLKSGKYPQVLMGAQTESDGSMDGCCKRIGYPTWVTPDDDPSSSSNKPVSAKGVAKAVHDAVMSVWHLWEEEPEFTYFAETMESLEDQASEPMEGDTALVVTTDECKTGVGKYEYRKDVDAGEEDLKWRLNYCIVPGDEKNLVNFAVTHIVKGKYKENGMYYFDGTWNVLDADLSSLTERVDKLEEKFKYAVKVPNGEAPMLIATAESVEAAYNYPCDPNKRTLVFITG